jgi:hypothetical protein
MYTKPTHKLYDKDLVIFNCKEKFIYSCQHLEEFEKNSTVIVIIRPTIVFMNFYKIKRS